MPHVSQYTAYALLLEPQKMQNLVPSDKSLLSWAILGSGGADSAGRGDFGFITDQTARTTEAIMANKIIIKNNGFSEIKLNDKGNTG